MKGNEFIPVETTEEAQELMLHLLPLKSKDAFTKEFEEFNGWTGKRDGCNRNNWRCSARIVFLI
jgi:hypothetical protein